jgi:hypothetical protein
MWQALNENRQEIKEIGGSQSGRHEKFYHLVYNAVAFTLVSYSTYSPTLKMESICSSETSVEFQRTTEDRTGAGIA